jgi:hypothetical protein
MMIFVMFSGAIKTKRRSRIRAWHQYLQSALHSAHSIPRTIKISRSETGGERTRHPFSPWLMLTVLSYDNSRSTRTGVGRVAGVNMYHNDAYAVTCDRGS